MSTEFALRHAIHCIRNGGIIVYPTDTVYGIGCDPLRADAVDQINAIKGRDAGKGLILIASRIEQLDKLIDVPDQPAGSRAPVRPARARAGLNQRQSIRTKTCNHSVATAPLFRCKGMQFCYQQPPFYRTKL